MKGQIVIGFSVPEKYMASWEEFAKIIGSDEEFLDAMRKKAEQDKRYKKGRRNSSMIRFAISFYVREKKKERLNKVLSDERSKDIN